QLTTEHRRTLTELRRDVSRVSSLTRAKKFDEAEAALKAAEESIEKIAGESGLEKTDKAFAAVVSAIEVQRKAIAKATGTGTGGADGAISFSKDVAPIIADKCMGCHGENASGGLRLDTFAGMRRGGRSGALIVPGSPQRSLMALRLIAAPPQRMPKNGNALEQDQIKIIADWITQGAKFDGTDQNLSMSELVDAAKMVDKPKITVAKPDGTETVSFTKDVAPMLVTFCHGCHSGNNPDSGFSVETFEKILIGGDSGVVLLPGKLEESRLFRLTGGLENPRMPQGQARITRKNYEDLKAWISEGIKYDSPDPKTPLLALVPSDAEIRRKELQAMTSEQMQSHRQEVANGHWRRTLSSAKTLTATDDEFLVMGNVEQARIDQVLSWADELRSQVYKALGNKQPPTWKGRLAIYVFKDRFDYDEFNRSIENREPANGLFGHARVTDSFENAYIALLDTGDQTSAQTPSAKLTLAKTMLSATLQIQSTTRVDWLAEGAGWALVDTSLRNADFEKTLAASAVRIMTEVDRPADLFQAGTFAPDVTERVGFVVTRFLLAGGTLEQFRQFATALHSGRNINDACRAVYKLDADEMAKTVLSRLK
ncbi:MAG: hypothetical protein KDA78_11385, partial [Planctomycetaceae bacterium]|nr:hypothetical protein [Planctomycetaceae bacterium]